MIDSQWIIAIVAALYQLTAGLLVGVLTIFILAFISAWCEDRQLKQTK